MVRSLALSGREWYLRLEHFLIGDVAALISFGEHFDQADSYDRFVLVNALGDGRQLAAPPAWKKSGSGYEINLQVFDSFPRINANQLGMDLALNEKHDSFVDEKGGIATVSGLDALPQKIQLCLSTLRGEMLYHRTFGSRLKEYFDDFVGSIWLERLFKLEVIRLACIPYKSMGVPGMYTPFQSVRQVRNVKILEERNDHWLPIIFDLEVEGVGMWSQEILIFVPFGGRSY
ncbi:hypothetical protein DK842_18530 [Chromobacterium phragmitis]|uniref:hypothetical protein n=1 Tax=Chromobacterium phragmitis TaxID=2202141 RepID=UPI000DEC9C32|nr:hypothetical protein [Chromobacterium phragmitis]AXE31721.1 hypothetical protein DK842_18530 [Chromobacterium phragmitis]